MDKNKVKNQLIKNLKNLEKTVMDLEDLYTEDNNSEFLHEMQDIIETNYYNIFPMSIDEWKLEIRGWIDELGKMNFPEPDDFKEHIGEKVIINKTQYTFGIEDDGIDSWCSWNSDNHKVAVMLNLDEYIGITFDLRNENNEYTGIQSEYTRSNKIKPERIHNFKDLVEISQIVIPQLMNEVKDFENAINVKCRCCTWNGWVPETQFRCPNCQEIDTFDIFTHKKISPHMITRSETMTQEDLYRFTDIGKKIEIFGSKFDLTTVHDLEGKHVIWTNGIIDIRVDICPRNGYEELENMDGIVIGISERNYGYMDLEQFVKKKPTNYLEFATICKNSIQELLKSTCPGFVGNGITTIYPTDQPTPDTEIIHVLAYHNGQIILSNGTIVNDQKTKK